MDKKSTPKPPTSSSFNPSIFDRAFVKVVETIVHNGSLTGDNKITRKELMQVFKLAETSYQNIKKGQRGVPIDRISELTAILVKDFGVSRRYLKTLSGGMFNETHENAELNNIVSEPSEVYLTSQHKVELLQKENEYLKELLKEKERLIDTLNTALEISRKK
jgi:hypothetical protein